MTFLRSLAVVASCVVLLPSAIQAQGNQTPNVQPASADGDLRRVYDAYAAWSAREGGYVEDADGEVRSSDYLPRVDAATQHRRLEDLRTFLKQLQAIPHERLSDPERVNASVLRTVLEQALADGRFREWEMPVNSDSNFWTYLNERQSLPDAINYRRYIARMRDIPRYFDEQIANMRAGLARKFTPPAITLAGRETSIASFIQPVDANAFYEPFKQMPSTIAKADQQQLRAEGRAAIEQAVLPAYQRLLTFYRDTYVPGARKTIAARDLPDGDAYYRSEVREYTTLDLTPEEIHALGLREVARIQAEMLATMKETGFKGTLPEFIASLRTDPRFIARTPDDLMGVSSYVAKRVDGKLVNYFGLLPRRRFTIIPVPDSLAPFYTAGRGGLESCQMNTYNLPSRPLYNIPALTLHECAPGHSFQAALSEEGKALPRFRRNLYFSGYGEGWGLYTEWLGREMGIYRNPYERFGQQSYEMWRAARLVIDTGVHRYGWSRQRAIDYLADHTALSKHEVKTEVDRYISWPGQALSYKLGELTIRRLRAEAERELGTGFDIRRFHDLILGMGAVPLPTMEEQVRRFITDSKATRPALK